MRSNAKKEILKYIRDVTFRGKVLQIFKDIIYYYPQDLRVMYINDIERFLFNIANIALSYAPGKKLLDIGGGSLPYPLVLQALGMEVTIVDDFKDRYINRYGAIELVNAIHRTHDVNIIEGDALELNLPLEDNSINRVTCFEVIEHFHHSPKRLFEDIVMVLKPGGFFILSTPNAVSIVKRIRALFCRTNYPSFRYFYFEGYPCRGHIREPVLSELLEVMSWNNLLVILKLGKNWLGKEKYPIVFKWPFKYLLNLLELFPTLCSNLIVIGVKGGERYD